MAGSKIFAGARLRRIRNRLEFSQAALAESLGISPSYLNLIERDQRPITAQILIKLNAQHGVDIAELGSLPASGDRLAQLKEVISDPLLVGEIPAVTELQEAAQVAPNLVGATVKLYQAYREVLKRLGDLSKNMVLGGAVQTEIPFDSVRHFVQQHIAFASLEALAEEIWYELSPKDDPMAGLKMRLRAHSGIDVRIIPVDIIGHDRARYDRHSQRLLISEKLTAPQRLWEVALLVAQLEGRTAIDDIITASPFAKHAESCRLLRQELGQVFALAILCPAARFKSSSEDLRCDIDALALRFSVSRLNCAKRLAMIFGFGFLSLDITGAVLEKFGPLGFHLPQSSNLCAQLPLFDRTDRAQAVSLKNNEGNTILMVAVLEESRMNGIVLSPDQVAKTIYTATVSRPLGPTCRLCDIKNCNLRREPPATRPAALNEFVRGASDFEPM